MQLAVLALSVLQIGHGNSHRHYRVTPGALHVHAIAANGSVLITDVNQVEDFVLVGAQVLSDVADDDAT